MSVLTFIRVQRKAKSARAVVDQRIEVGEIEKETRNEVTGQLAHALALMTGRIRRMKMATLTTRDRNDIVAVLGQIHAHLGRHALRAHHTAGQHIEMGVTVVKIGAAVVARQGVIDAVASGPMHQLYAVGDTGDRIISPMEGISSQGARVLKHTPILADLGHRARAAVQ